MNSIILASIILGLLIIVVPNIKKILDTIIEKLVSIFFIKISLDSSSNVTASSFENISNELVEKARIKFLSRQFITDKEREIKHGYGLYTCYKDFLYFAVSSFDGPFTLNGFWGDPTYVVKKMDIYIPFWRRKIFEENIESVSFNDDESLNHHFIGDRNLSIKIQGIDGSMYNQEDVSILKNEIETLMNDLGNTNKFITLSARNSSNLVKHVVETMKYDMITLYDKDSRNIRQNSIDFLVSTNTLQKTNKPVIIYIDCTNGALSGGENCRYEASYTNFTNGFYPFLFSDKKVVVILDYVGSKAVDTIEYVEDGTSDIDTEVPEKRIVFPRFFTKFKQNSKHIEVRDK